MMSTRDLEKLESAALAAYSELQNGNTESAKRMLRTGLLGGSVNSPQDIDRCNKEWIKKYSLGG